MKPRNVTAPEHTLKDVAADNQVGPVNPSGLKDNSSYRKANIDVPVTSKDMNSANRYKGQPHKNLGMGFKKQRISNWVTNKETNQFSTRGNAKNSVMAHMSYDAVFDADDAMDRTVEGDRYGIAKSRILGAKKTGEVENNTCPPLEVEDYVGNPLAVIPKGRDREAFDNSVEDTGGHRVEFGGHINPAKRAIGTSANRNAAMKVKEDGSVEGRFNVPMRRDNPNGEGLATETQLKEEREVVERNTIQRTQPLQVVTDRMPVLIKSRNVEAVNPRLDTGTRITSDLYPWIKDK
jgi:hypothetical protein